MNAHVATTMALALCLACAADAVAQQGQGPAGQQGARPPGPPQQAADLVFEREVFDYPSFQRRNPFRRLVGTGTGPRYESMSLQGIIYSAGDPSQSMALMSAGGGGEAAATTQSLRQGQRWGNVRILEIRRNEVVVEVEEFGLTEQKIMQLPTRGQGGS